MGKGVGEVSNPTVTATKRSNDLPNVSTVL